MRALGQVLSVSAARVLLGHIVVAHRAIDPADVVGMGQIVGPTVAVGALEEAVDGFCEGVRVGVVAVGTCFLGRHGRGENGRGEQQQRVPASAATAVFGRENRAGRRGDEALIKRETPHWRPAQAPSDRGEDSSRQRRPNPGTRFASHVPFTELCPLSILKGASGA